MNSMKTKMMSATVALLMSWGVWIGGAAQAQERPVRPVIAEVPPDEHSVGGSTTNSAVVDVGGSVSAAGHGGAGKPGLKLPNTNYPHAVVNIETFSRGFTARGVTVNGNAKFKLENFMHRGAGPDLRHIEIDWTRIDFGGAAPLWFGVTLDKALKQAGGFYVGDRTDRTVPSVDTRYAVDAILHVTEGYAKTHEQTAGTHYLSGVLALDALNNKLTTDGDLVGSGGRLSIDANVRDGGTFEGTAKHGWSAGQYVDTTGKVNGEFFGGGSLTSAVAGTVKGSGDTYHAAFGGLAQ